MILPYFIVLEGIDGSGTTSQAHSLKEWAESIGLKVLLTAEPDELNPIGKFLRETLNRKVELHLSPDDLQVALSLLFVADRFVHTKHLEKIAEDYDIIICDRYTLSTVAYQSQSKLVTQTWLRMLHGHCPDPDLVILLDCDAEVAATRLSGPKDIMEEKIAFQEAVALAYVANLKSVHGEDTVVRMVDANQGEDVVEELLKVIAIEHLPHFRVDPSQ